MATPDAGSVADTAVDSGTPDTSVTDSGVSADVVDVTAADTTADSVDASDAASPSGYAYGVPLDPASPWPKFRRTARQDGRSPVLPVTGGEPWSFQTGKGIFSTPVIGGDGTVYVGSADRTFYALWPDGTLRWKVETGEIIDSSALLDDKGRIYFGSGDGILRCLDAKTGEVVWTLEADDPAKTGGFIRWFEGNVAMQPEGTLLVPNDNFRLYAVDRDTGTVVWKYVMPDQTWSLPALDVASGTAFVGNNNLLPFLGDNVFAIGPNGDKRWSASVTGTVAASPLLTESGLVVVGGFDGYVRAYDADDGHEVWATGTRDHIYASPAELPDGTLVQPSADGTVYGISPVTGAITWAFDTREALRSSPAIDGAGNIYLGSGEGRLFVLDATGALRYAMRLIDDDRNDLNASPALAQSSVLIAGESGEVFSIPYDYCLGATDARCTLGPDEDLPDDGAHLLFTTRFGAPLDQPPATIQAHDALAFSLLVREGGDTRLALLDAAALSVEVSPDVPVQVEVSGDRRFMTIVPDGNFVVDPDTSKLNIHVTGQYLVDPDREGLKMTGGSPGGPLDETFTFALAEGTPGALPLPIPKGPGEPSGALELYRMAAPLPAILPSYNQIGFDSLHYLIGLVEGDDKGAVGWVVGGLIDPETGDVAPDPATRVLFPVTATWDEGRLLLRNRDGFAFEVLNVSLGFDTFRVAATLAPSGEAPEPASVQVSAVCSDIAFYGPFLEQLGLCSPDTDTLLVYGAVLVRPFSGGSVTAPAGVGAVTIAPDGSGFTATLTGSTLLGSEHRLSLLLVDGDTGEPVSLDYGPATTQLADEGGVLQSVSLKADSKGLPATIRIWLMVDTAPAAMTTLSLN